MSETKLKLLYSFWSSLKESDYEDHDDYCIARDKAWLEYCAARDQEETAYRKAFAEDLEIRGVLQ